MDLAACGHSYGLGAAWGWDSSGYAQIAPRVDRPPLILMRDGRADSFGGWQTGKENPEPWKE